MAPVPSLFVPTMSDPVTHTALEPADLAHVYRLVASWQSLADLSFSDLLLLAPIAGDDERSFVVLAHVRPTTGQTLYPDDLVGTVVDEGQRPLLGHAWREGAILVGGGVVIGSESRPEERAPRRAAAPQSERGGHVDVERARVHCIPVRHRGEMIALLTREAATTSGRRHGELERNYLDVFDRFATMISEGSFPFGRDELPYEDTPSVADGAIVLDADLRIVFASPNAVSSLHRMGIHAYTQGLTLDEIGFDTDAVVQAVRARLPVDEELEHGDAAFTLRAIPLLEGDESVGAVIFLRDVTDLRRRDRMLLSKDATIREIHHRVKNSLQTIAALLRLQGRRLASREAQDAIIESERRIRSIAIVHEILSHDPGDVVSFDELIRPLVRIVEDSVSTPDVRLDFVVEGEAGELRGDVATPLAVVLNELMQNAVDHGFARDGDSPVKGRVELTLSRGDDELTIAVADDGSGLPPDFALDRSNGLGLSIVHALVTQELGGSIEVRPGDGACFVLRVPLAQAAPVDL